MDSELLQDLSPEVGDTLLNTKLAKKHTICNQVKYVWQTLLHLSIGVSFGGDLETAISYYLNIEKKFS